MKIELSKMDRFIDYIKTKGPETTTAEMREDLKGLRLWSDDELSRTLDKYLDHEVRRMVGMLPEYDEDGNVIERVHVVRKTKEGKKEVYVNRSFLDYKDAEYAINYRIKKGNYFYDEARRLLDSVVTQLPVKQGRKLRRTFQGLLDFKPEVIT